MLCSIPVSGCRQPHASLNEFNNCWNCGNDPERPPWRRYVYERGVQYFINTHGGYVNTHIHSWPWRYIFQDPEYVWIIYICIYYHL